MNNSDNASFSFIRLFLGIAASVAVGAIVSQQVDIIGTPLAVLVSIMTALAGILSTVIINAVAPRREKPSRYGNLAMIIFLAAYVVLGKILWSSASPAAFLAYIAAGCVYIWLVLTAVAETALIYAIGFGGFFSGFLGVVTIATYTSPFRELLSHITTPAERTMIYTSIGLICAFSGAFAAVSGRLSGWGLAENKTTQTWTFDEKGMLVIRKD